VNEFERTVRGMLALDAAIRAFGAAVTEVRVRSITEDRVAADVRLRPSTATVTITIDATD
jgi:hypothetical protein